MTNGCSQIRSLFLVFMLFKFKSIVFIILIGNNCEESDDRQQPKIQPSFRVLSLVVISYTSYTWFIHILFPYSLALSARSCNRLKISEAIRDTVSHTNTVHTTNKHTDTHTIVQLYIHEKRVAFESVAGYFTLCKVCNKFTSRAHASRRVAHL